MMIAILYNIIFISSILYIIIQCKRKELKGISKYKYIISIISVAFIPLTLLTVVRTIINLSSASNDIPIMEVNGLASLMIAMDILMYIVILAILWVIYFIANKIKMSRNK